MSDRKAVIKNADMSEEMQQDAVECATQALEKYNIEKDIAAHIKKVGVCLCCARGMAMHWRIEEGECCQASSSRETSSRD